MRPDDAIEVHQGVLPTVLPVGSVQAGVAADTGHERVDLRTLVQQAMMKLQRARNRVGHAWVVWAARATCSWMSASAWFAMYSSIVSWRRGRGCRLRGDGG